jgi:hypothetical protein
LSQKYQNIAKYAKKNEIADSLDYGRILKKFENKP